MRMVWVYFWLGNYDIIDIFLNKFDFLDEKKHQSRLLNFEGYNVVVMYRNYCQPYNES